MTANRAPAPTLAAPILAQLAAVRPADGAAFDSAAAACQLSAASSFDVELLRSATEIASAERYCASRQAVGEVLGDLRDASANGCVL